MSSDLSDLSSLIFKGSRFIVLTVIDKNDEEILLKGNGSGKQFMVCNLYNFKNKKFLIFIFLEAYECRFDWGRNQNPKKCRSYKNR